MPPRTTDSAVKIVGGEPVAEGDPVAGYTVALVRPGGAIFCSGFLVEADLVVTAAHCLTPSVTAAGMFVSVGRSTRTGWIASVKSHRPHPDFDASQREAGGTPNDIGWIRLTTPVPPEVGLPVAMLPDEEYVVAYGSAVHLAGFGVTSSEGGGAGVLRATTTFLSVASPGSKEVYFHSLSVRNACFGDSGGPALVDADGKLKVFGVAAYVISTSAGACESGLSAYSDLRAYRDWLPLGHGAARQ